MMRRDLTGDLEEHGCVLLREGEHAIYAQGSRRATVPRHTEIRQPHRHSLTIRAIAAPHSARASDGTTFERSNVPTCACFNGASPPAALSSLAVCGSRFSARGEEAL
jgi:hypothetical protein